MLALAIATLAFTSCEDVPAPFDTDYHENGGAIPTDPTGEGTLASPYNVAKVIQIIKAGEQTEKEVYFKGIITNIKEIDTGQFGNAIYSVSDTKEGKNSFLVYRGKGLNGQKFTTGNEINVGDTVVVLGQLTIFNGTLETTPGSKIISINGKGGTGGDDTSTGLTINGTTVTAVNAKATAGATTATINLGKLTLAKGAEVTTVQLSDGSTITFGGGENTNNKPVFYPATKGVRVYANNIIKFDCKAKIAKIVFTCDAYNGQNYVGNKTATITFDGNKGTYINKHFENKGGVQLRVQTITVTYAK